MWVDHMVDHFSTYIYQKRGFFYFSRRVPKEVQQCHSKQRIVLALNTKSRAKALKYSQVICQRLDERWLPMRLDALGLGNVMANDVRTQKRSLSFGWNIMRSLREWKITILNGSTKKAATLMF